MVSVRQRGPRLPKKPQVRRQNRRDPDELRSTYQQSYWYHVTGSTGTLFLYGIVVGAIAMFGLSLLLSGARRTSRRGREARRGLKQSRRETDAAIHDRDDLVHQREATRAENPGRPAGGGS